jgi:hypothetical protein
MILKVHRREEWHALMTKDELRSRLDRAIDVSRRLAEKILGYPVPSEVRFHLGDIARFQTKKPVQEGMVRVLGGRILRPSEIENLDASKVAKFLWVDGKVPVWINLHARRSDERAYFVEVATSETLTEDESRFYHKGEGNPPFHVLFPENPVSGTFARPSR